MGKDAKDQLDALYDKAADIAEKHLNAAIEEGGDELAYLVAVMMVESAVNVSVDLTSKEDVVTLLKDLARQIEQDIEEDE